jgi:glycosyltransferase involved in cell wall biosynthesis
MKYGCPVASANTGSLLEICSEAALMFNPKNVDEIAESLSKIINDKTLANKLIEKGFKQEKKFTWGKTIKEMVQVYQEVTSRSV